MSKSVSILTGVKYAYLTAIFALLSSILYPFVQGGSLDYSIYGIIVLFVGLAGGIMMYKASTSDKKRGIYLGIGLGLVAISLLFVLELTGRPLF